MATADVRLNNTSSFVYEVLVSRVQQFQNEIQTSLNVLNNQLSNDQQKTNDLKQHSFNFVDPYGYEMAISYFDHEYIMHILKKYKRDYIPKYLAQWIQFGFYRNGCLSKLCEDHLRSTVSSYVNERKFVTFGELIVWVGSHQGGDSMKIVLKMLLTDSMEKIIAEIHKLNPSGAIELKLLRLSEDREPNDNDWERGQVLAPTDTIMSKQLFQSNSIVMVKVIKINLKQILS